MATSKSDKPKAADKKVMDVAKPGKSAPSSTSKPVIVGHKPMIQDPMVTPSENGEGTEPAKEEKATATRSVKKIVPLGDQAETAETSDEKPAETEAAPEAATEEKAAEQSSEEPEEAVAEEAAAAPTEEPADKPSTDENAAVDAIANQATKRKEGDLTEEEKKKAEAINKLIEDKTYYLKIGQANQKRNNTIYALLALVLLVVIGGALAIDAGMIESNITLPFDLISN